jgi:hypothetical protein
VDAPLVTVDELRDYMQRPVADAAGALAIAGASGIVRAHCGWYISRQDDVIWRLSGTNTRVLNLPTLYLAGVTSVTLDGIPLTDFRWAQRGQLYRSDIWPDFRQIEVTATHGYTDIPDVVRVVTLAYAARQIANPERLKSASVGSVNRAFDLTDLDQALLHPYRIFTTT